jgi:hypothetical protein
LITIRRRNMIARFLIISVGSAQPAAAGAGQGPGEYLSRHGGISGSLLAGSVLVLVVGNGAVSCPS